MTIALGDSLGSDDGSGIASVHLFPPGLSVHRDVIRHKPKTIALGDSLGSDDGSGLASVHLFPPGLSGHRDSQLSDQQGVSHLVLLFLPWTTETHKIKINRE